MVGSELQLHSLAVELLCECIQSALEGVCDIGMSSRELKDSEKEAGLTPTVMALDGIAVIVNKDNRIGTLSSEQIQSIYIGETISWADVK